MTDPTTTFPCPVCKGTGQIGGKCPYNSVTEVDCGECEGSCETEMCQECDGTGELTEEQFKYNNKYRGL